MCILLQAGKISERYSWPKPTHKEIGDLKMLEQQPGEVAQAFSHYSCYFYTKRQLLLVDLQGKVLPTGQRQVIKLTDPAIHTFDEVRRRQYGITDKGQEGIKRFFKHHQCNALCKALGVPSALEQKSYHTGLDNLMAYKGSRAAKGSGKSRV